MVNSEQLKTDHFETNSKKKKARPELTFKVCVPLTDMDLSYSKSVIVWFDH